MITEILEAAINEVLVTGKFEISEFQIGKEIYLILKDEIESTLANVSVDIYSINHFRGIPVKIHSYDTAIVYCLKLKK